MPSKLNNLELKQLVFDPQNPRLPQYLLGKSDTEIIEYLLLECDLIDLMLSIGEKDFFEGEPLLVVPTNEGNTYTVVEGNRRLGALKLLSAMIIPPVMPTQVAQVIQSSQFHPANIPVLIFQTRDEILGYLGYRHITGTKEWNSLAKARYLRQLRNRYADLPNDQAHKKLAKEIGSKSHTVAKLLTGLTLLEKARDLGILSKLHKNEDDIHFSILTTGIGFDKISAFIGLNDPQDVEALSLNEAHFSEFFYWAFDNSLANKKTVLGESRNLEKMARIVHNPEALAQLRLGVDIDEADLFTSGPLEVVRLLMQEAERKIERAQQALSRVDGLQETDKENAKKLRNLATSLHASILAQVSPMD